MKRRRRLVFPLPRSFHILAYHAISGRMKSTKEVDPMKILIRLLTAPIALAVWLCAGLLYVSSFLFGLASTALAILAVVVIMAGSPINGIILLGIAFLVSPLGLPLLAVQMLGGLQRMRNALVNRF